MYRKAWKYEQQEIIFRLLLRSLQPWLRKTATSFKKNGAYKIFSLEDITQELLYSLVKLLRKTKIANPNRLFFYTMKTTLNVLEKSSSRQLDSGLLLQMAFQLQLREQLSASLFS